MLQKTGNLKVEDFLLKTFIIPSKIVGLKYMGTSVK